jgi:hypothetical protein
VLFSKDFYLTTVWESVALSGVICKGFYLTTGVGSVLVRFGVWESIALMCKGFSLATGVGWDSVAERGRVECCAARASIFPLALVGFFLL